MCKGGIFLDQSVWIIFLNDLHKLSSCIVILAVAVNLLFLLNPELKSQQIQLVLKYFILKVKYIYFCVIHLPVLYGMSGALCPFNPL